MSFRQTQSPLAGRQSPNRAAASTAWPAEKAAGSPHPTFSYLGPERVSPAMEARQSPLPRSRDSLQRAGLLVGPAAYPNEYAADAAQQAQSNTPTLGATILSERRAPSTLDFSSGADAATATITALSSSMPRRSNPTAGHDSLTTTLAGRVVEVTTETTREVQHQLERALQETIETRVNEAVGRLRDFVTLLVGECKRELSAGVEQWSSTSKQKQEQHAFESLQQRGHESAATEKLLGDLKNQLAKTVDHLDTLRASTEKSVQDLREQQTGQLADLLMRVSTIEQSSATSSADTGKIDSRGDRVNLDASGIRMTTLQERVAYVEKLLDDSGDTRALVETAHAKLQVLERRMEAVNANPRVYPRAESAHTAETPEIINELQAGVEQMKVKLRVLFEMQGAQTILREQQGKLTDRLDGVMSWIGASAEKQKQSQVMESRLLNLEQAASDKKVQLAATENFIQKPGEENADQMSLRSNMEALEERLTKAFEEQLNRNASVGATRSEAPADVNLIDGLKERVEYVEGLLGDAIYGSHESLDGRFSAVEHKQVEVQEKLTIVDGHLSSIQRQAARTRLEAMQNNAHKAPVTASPRRAQPVPRQQANDQLDEVIDFIGVMDTGESRW